MRLAFVAVVIVLACAGCASANDQVWHSAAVDRELRMTCELPASAATRPASLPAVIVLRQLPFDSSSDQAKSAARDAISKAGNALIEIDYANDARASVESLTRDLLKLRSDIKEKKLLLDPAIDIDWIWIVPEGVAVKRDVTFYATDQKTWQLDIAYPVDAKSSPGTLLEITCDNASRMGNVSLVYCRDTLLEGGLLRGFAAVMIDHPVPAPYKGLDDPMPELIHRLKSAVRTVRAHATATLGISDRIGAIGFSRGGPMAAFLAVTNGRAEFDVGGEHPAISSDVQAAFVHGNRYDYSKLRADDPMLARFEKAWGPREQNADRWLAHGAVHYLRDSAAPIYLSTSDTESAEYRQGLADLREALFNRSLDHVYAEDQDGRGHTVTTDSERLDAIYTFLSGSLAR